MKLRLTLLALVLPASTLAQQPAAPVSPAAWDLRAAEHLMNRAGFGARPAELEALVAQGREAAVAQLLDWPAVDSDPYYADWLSMQGRGAEVRDMPREERQKMGREMRRKDGRQLNDFAHWWVERMVDGDDPLRERMTMFWHGYFTSSMQDVKNSYEMITQNQLFRDTGLGSFADLLRAVARDPAMLEYLDNDVNKKGKPNENFARELLELFTLGEGNYTEEDVKEAARAFTGWTDRNGRFVFAKRQHDRKPKTFLGVTGRFDGDDILTILLEQEACAAHLAGELLTYFEGQEPTAARRAKYAELLRANGYHVGETLRSLFLDSEFYRSEVVGTRIAGPVDFLVGTARRLDVEPPPELLVTGAAVLGQRLLFPPNVKGWDGGRAWITTSTLMQRGNLGGLMLGVVSVDELLSAEPDPTMLAEDVLEDEPTPDMESPGEMSGEMSGEMDAGMEAAGRDRPRRPKSKPGIAGRLRALDRMDWRPRIFLAARLADPGAGGDRQMVSALVDEVLAVPVSEQTRAYLVDLLKEEREARGISTEDMRDDPRRSEPLLRRIAHLALCLPEAQLD
jgi:uncharacterized protein (DUF1800 family)